MYELQDVLKEVGGVADTFVFIKPQPWFLSFLVLLELHHSRSEQGTQACLYQLLPHLEPQPHRPSSSQICTRTVLYSPVSNQIRTSNCASAALTRSPAVQPLSLLSALHNSSFRRPLSLSLSSTDETLDLTQLRRTFLRVTHRPPHSTHANELSSDQY
ncbi:hypothetical protein SAY86_022525 [Trapa natans]|uniref:Uncharacterized protein n=1 Tax=Trapa natans TaxID=22666 RepID=A0AAN7LTN6_TRANT|nr:hypothetical protein SAY86_022525 [Trapa natans]